jgi:hypothetical protein
MHYCNANSTLESKFDRERIIKLADNLIADFNAESIKQITNSGCDDERPVFIVGMPRSGTSLVEQILSSHPQIYGAGELSDIKNIAISYIQATRSNNVKIFSHTERAKLYELAGKYQKVIEQTCGNAILVTDKMPSNFLWLGFIMQLFPKARIIHCKRDPRDTCLSIYFQQFTKSHDYANKLEDLAFYYRQYERLMHHWKYHLHVPMLDVYYKDLVLDIETKARQMVDYLGLQWDDRCLAYYESKRATATASWDQVRQPIYTKSLGRWRHYQKHLGPLLDEFGSDEAALSIATEKICKQA